MVFSASPRRGGGRAIVDCSRLLGSSINNYTNKVATTFLDKSVDTVVSVMKKGDYMVTSVNRYCIQSSTYSH